MKKKLYSIILTIICIAVLLPYSSALAVETAQRSLTVTVDTDKTEYKAIDEIQVQLTLNNANIFPLSDVRYEIVAPDGYIHTTNTAGIQRVGKMGIDETVTPVKTILSPVPNMPQTGDNGQPVLWLTLMFGALGTIVILSISRQRLAKQLTSLFLCLIMVSSMLLTVPASAKADSSSVSQTITVEKKIKVDNVATTIIVRVFYGFDSNPIIGNGDANITRGEWIAYLVDNVFALEHLELLESAFNDTAGTAYETQINTAAAHCYLSSAVNQSFRPDDTASRDFAAAMAIRFLGFSTDGVNNIVCSDSSHVQYSKEAALALEFGLLNLTNGLYQPTKALANSEAAQILAATHAILDSTNISGSGGSGLTFRDNVVLLDGVTYQDNNNTIILSDANSLNAKPGDIIVLNLEKSIKVTSITRNGDSVHIGYSEPELYEVLDKVESYGIAYLDFSRFVPAEGVTIESSPMSLYSARGSINNPFGPISPLKGTFDLGNDWKLKFGISIDIPAIYYKFDVDFNWPWDWPIVDAKNVYIKLDTEITGEGSLAREINNNGGEDFWHSSRRLEGDFKIGSIPLVGFPGFGMLFEIYAVITAEGAVRFTLKAAGPIGVQVYNNRVRNMTDMELTPTLDLAGEVRTGPKLYACAQFVGKDMISFGAFAGVKGGGSVDWHPSVDMVCLDGTVGYFLDVTAMENTYLGDKLDLEAEWTVLDGDWLHGHWENLRRVAECTYRTGVINGTVAEAENRNKRIEDASISLYDDRQTLSGTASSDNNGSYTITVAPGDYILKVSAPGYIPFESLIKVEPNHETVIETLLMVAGDEDTTETGKVSGKITDSTTGESISNVTLTIYKGWNKTSGAPVTQLITNSAGKYDVSLLLGNYTVVMEKDGYTSNHFNIAVTSNGIVGNGSMSPISADQSDKLRIVLTWGETPLDLDSHLRGNETDYHVYYANESYQENNQIVAFLDVDDVTSYGPETVTINQLNRGSIYRYYVHDFTNRADSASVAMANSGAKVEVYRGSTHLKTFHIPANDAGTVWHVFNYDAGTGKIIPVNEFSSQGDSSAVGDPTNYMARGRMIISPDKK